MPTRHGCNYNRQQSYKICFLWFHISWISNDCFNVIFATDIQLIPVREIGLIVQGFSYIVFATDIQPITVRKIVTFITESCFPEAYCHHKCPMAMKMIASTDLGEYQGVLKNRLTRKRCVTVGMSFCLSVCELMSVP